MTDIAAIRKTIEATGLLCRGGFHPAKRDRVPGTPGTLVLVGNAGPEMWAAFEAARREDPDPLDAWTRRTLDGVARELGATALYPFQGPPYLPFQRWAMRAEPVYASPLGALIHPDYGVWHAYRGALAFVETIDLPPRDDRPSPCDTCKARPCLAACPVNAFGPEGYHVQDCVGHLAEPAGRECMETGCAARRACPVGQDFFYPAPQVQHHMERFLAAYGPG